ncbi:MAG: N-succinylarginine dihydrolase [Hyphomonadaceae bacterium]|nr:N-succinylarginine dihydrolase [Hyphomonadaceae bacterium]MBC6411708.1 N-succinylarginine dihydrolase [Hyphomonadaceae bacterium]
MAQESNFDGLIGPTHNYGGLSDGNLASAHNAGRVACPRDAALQGLAKMKAMHDVGLWQGLLPPHQRPFLPGLRQAGFSGSDRQVYETAWKVAPVLAKNMMSASSMWAANAATVSPSPDCRDEKLHLTPANLTTMLHRSIEHEQTGAALGAALPFSQVHNALPLQSVFSDEGAANHVRLCASHGDQGVEMFVYGRDGYAPPRSGFPARQTLEAGEAIARRHGLKPEQTVFIRQSGAAIDAGAFHNDVVCVGALHTLFYHEQAFADTATMRAAICEAARVLFEPVFVEVPEADVPLADAISSYLFNSMLVKFPEDDRLTLIAPTETRDTDSTRIYCDKLVVGNGPVAAVRYVDVRQSMHNGGGPACLRLRVSLTDEEWAQVNPKQKLDDASHAGLVSWVERHYRETLAMEDLPDPALMDESFAALDELTGILGLGSNFYPFQRA